VVSEQKSGPAANRVEELMGRGTVADDAQHEKQEVTDGGIHGTVADARNMKNGKSYRLHIPQVCCNL
jgi:hypothetical protein